MEDLAAKLSGGGRGGPPADSLDDAEDPIWVPVTVAYNGLTWTNVGMRYKGESVLLDEIGEEWPFIRYLLDDTEYRQAYLAGLQLALETAMPLARVSAEIASLHELIAPYVVGPKAVEQAPYTFLSSAQSFTDSQQELISHLQGRHTAVSAVLGLSN